ncbi:transglycosylase SLT domain-containing protein [Rhodopseudomonas sp. B29]|uniref:transglycosylase SLT domain-containing protein n=1 Tax=Rhodopseudomonas sp. B29 TaxID=95607 RepID=UPI00034C265B|nr:transglycosylase SLT domain-containing protein [Rhodopseudomonas sp. B29]
MAVDATNSGATVVDPARTGIAGAIRQAANATGASFEYLLTTAKMESNFNPSAQATTSSAKGLFQFIEQTWLGTVKEAGSALGFGQYADAISKSDSGSYSVSDPAARKAIMDLRNDPAVSSAMAGVLTQSNSFKLTGEIGRRPSDAELYMAHFMGVNGAAKLINNATDNPNAIGATLFPNAAAANASIFYDQSGSPRTVAQVYANLSARYDAAAGSSATKSAMASVGVSTNSPVTLASAMQASDADAAYLSGFPDVRNPTPASGTSSPAASVNGTTAAVQRSNDPMFRTLFIGGDRSEAVSPAVAQIWNNSSAPAQAAPVTLSRTPDVRAPSPLDLFSDRNGTFAG